MRDTQVRVPAADLEAVVEVHDPHKSSIAFRALEFYGTHLRHPGQWRFHEYIRRHLELDVDHSYKVERQGFTWILNPADFVEADLFWFGEKDHWDSYHIRQFLRPDGVVFDVGANFGYYSIAVFRQCRVFAFEPFPKTESRLRRNIGLNRCQSITVVPFALSDSNGNSTMTVRADNSGAARIDGSQGIGVRLLTLDSFCQTRGIGKIDFMKIDVEGHEESVLRGGIETIRAMRPALMIELDPVQLRRSGSTVESLITTLRTFGYRLMIARKKSLVPLTKVPSDGDVINAFCLP